jgi:cell division protein FtsN
MPSGDGTEKIVSREETPVDINRSGAPRVVFPPLNQNANPPAAPGVSTSTMPPADGASGAAPTNGTLPSSEPRKIKTFAVRGDQPDSAAVPVGASPPAPPKATTAAPKAAPPATRGAVPAPANAPLSLSPDAAPPAAPAADTHSRVATTTPGTPPAAAPAASGGYLVQVSSQRNESDAQASFKTLQNKFPSVLGSQTPLIKRADLGDKGVYYRAMVGPFPTPEEAAQFCGSLKSAGGQCVVQKN